jgi:hypothetical protein
VNSMSASTILITNKPFVMKKGDNNRIKYKFTNYHTVDAKLYVILHYTLHSSGSGFSETRLQIESNKYM